MVSRGYQNTLTVNFRDDGLDHIGSNIVYQTISYINDY
jgi:hypothetical protein